MGILAVLCVPCNRIIYRPNYLIMDEPTNHLDVETVEALGKALNNFKVMLSIEDQNFLLSFQIGICFNVVFEIHDFHNAHHLLTLQSFM